MSLWNVNGWTTNNSILRKEVIANLKSDIFCIVETHLTENSSITIGGYSTIIHNRSFKHKRAIRGSGGVAILIKDTILQSYKVTVSDKSIDGVLCVELKQKLSEFIFHVFLCYLPPDNSVWGRDADAFFGHLIAELYLRSYSDCVLVCGDFNSRIGKELDYIDGVDNIGVRSVIDETQNNHGASFLEFLRDCKLCILNGRVTSNLDNFTCVSSKGKSVVDYLCVPHNCVEFCKEFRVDTVSDLLATFDLFKLLSSNCKPPDHSVLTAKLSFTQTLEVDESNLFASGYCNYGESAQGLPDQNPNEKRERRRYNFANIDNSFMNNNAWRLAMSELITRLERVQVNKDILDEIYSGLCRSVFNEMDSYLEYRNVRRGTGKKLRTSKPYWNDELTKLWRDVHLKQTAFLRFKGTRSEKNKCFSEYKVAQRTFDKRKRQTERQYYKSTLLKIETVCTDNPKEFWKCIKKLGPKRRADIPMKVRVGNNVESDPQVVIDTWQKEFECLYNRPQELSREFDKDFREMSMRHKAQLESEMDDGSFVNELLNEPLDLTELRRAVAKLKNEKASGYDRIPNEVLKHPKIENLLLTFFSNCFNSGLIPSEWQKAVITPIPKGSEKRPKCADELSWN